uniref:Protein kinase domain-containing protein n=1 Tax=Glossina brevipalpis TaxID=37001 RepID=A0A1A9W8K8_9MUSC
MPLFKKWKKNTHKTKENEEETYSEALKKFIEWRKMKIQTKEDNNRTETSGLKLDQEAAAAVTEGNSNRTLNDYVNWNHYENIGNTHSTAIVNESLDHSYAMPYEHESSLEYSVIPPPPPSPPSTSRLMVTDLDASIQPNEIMQETFDFLMGTWGDIKFDHVAPFAFGNTYVQHGEFNSDSISLISAMKSTKDSYAGECNNFNALRQCRHPNIVLLMGIILDDYSKLTALLVEPLKCSLYDMIYQERNYIEVRECHNYLEQLANAVGYLHLKRILHTNICSENVVISRLSQTLKLAGFELCIAIDGASAFSYFSYNPLNRTKYAKYYYQAPELLTASLKPTIQSDIYGVCLLLWEILNCHLPYVHLSQTELAKLKYATLTIFRKRRCMPFKKLLDKGLAIPVELRYSDIKSLKIELKTIGELDLKAFDDQPNSLQHTNEIPPRRIRSKLYRVNILINSNTNEYQAHDDISEAFNDFYIDDDLNESSNVNIALRIN